MTERWRSHYDTKLIKSANSIWHDKFRQFLLDDQILDKLLSNQIPMDNQDNFLDFYPRWIASSRLNSFLGLEAFPHRYMSLGVTQAIEDFHMWSFRRGKHVRMFKGEYPYSRDIIDWDWSRDYIDDRPLTTGDSVIISLPFSATGDIHERWIWLMRECNQKNIPVFVDCAFFGTCRDITVDLNEPCINTVAFSPTKGLCCGNYRTGICFTHRTDRECSLGIQTDWHHGVHLNTSLALALMKQFSPDTVQDAWVAVQHRVCEFYGLTPSKTVHLALGGDGWEHFSRDGLYNRICIKNVVKDFR